MKTLDERIKSALSPVDKKEIYDELLDECYGEIKIGNITFDPSRVLKELDPIAYDCGLYDYLSDGDFYELDDEFYLQEEVDKIIKDMEDE